MILVVLGLALLAGFAFFLGLQAFKSVNAFRSVSQQIQTAWDDRVTYSSLPDQEAVKGVVTQDKQKLQELTNEYRRLYHLVSFALVGLVALVLLAFIAYRIGFVLPLRRLEQSCHNTVSHDLKDPIWGIERGDQLGSLARSINAIRGRITKLSDMVVEGPDGTAHVHFEGRGAAMFNTLISELKESISTLQQQGEKLEKITEGSEQKLQTIDETVQKHGGSLEAAVDASRIQLAGLRDDWDARFEQLQDTHKRREATLETHIAKLEAQEGGIQAKAQALIDKFQRDMLVLNQVASATGQRVTQTLSNLAASDRDIRRAARQSLEASATFAAQAQDLHEKLANTTTLLKASGKVMSETSESARVRLLEAVNTVENTDASMRSFLKDTMDKTNQLSGLLDSLSGSAERAAHTVESFDSRMTQFEEKSDTAFARIEGSVTTIEDTSSRFTTAYDGVNDALHTMGSHADTLARVLSAVRDEYASFTQEWRGTLSDAVPALSSLRDAASTMHRQVQDEWQMYSQQSRALLGALEHDVRGMNFRATQVSDELEKVNGLLGVQAQRLQDNAGHFDLQIAGLSQRVEAAASSVLRSNDSLLKTTAGQINDMHGAVADLVQRLGILTQLASTLGAVAGQLGQIVPALSESHALPRVTAQPASAVSSTTEAALLARFDEINTAFTGTIGSIKGEFDVVRGQINSWVAMITQGYQKLNGEMHDLSRQLDEKIASARSAMVADVVENVSRDVVRGIVKDLPALLPTPVVTPPAQALNLGEQLMPALHLVHEGLEKNHVMDNSLVHALQGLQGHIQAMAGDSQQTVKALHNLATFIEEGFTRVESAATKQAETPREWPPIKIDMSRVENAAQYLEAITIALKNQAGDLVAQLGTLAGGFAETYTKLDDRIAAAPLAMPALPQATPALEVPSGSHLDQLQAQIDKIAAILENCASRSAYIAPEESAQAQEKPRQIVETVMTAISRLHQIAESIERVADQGHGEANGNKKAG